MLRIKVLYRATLEAVRGSSRNFPIQIHTFGCKDSSEILTKGYENALLLVTQAIDTIMTGEGIDDKDLVIISKTGYTKIQEFILMYPRLTIHKILYKGNKVQDGIYSCSFQL